MTHGFTKPFATALFSIVSIFGVSIGQTTENSSATRVFAPDYFSQYAPQNAFDMVQRVPGFQTRGGNNARGLGQGGANVLINGQQIVGKGGDPFDQVARISVENVTRIEVLDGSSLDIPGLTGQVVNVVADAKDGISGSWEWQGRWRKNHEPNLIDGNIKVSGETGNLAFAGELGNDAFRGGGTGPEIRRNADNSIYEEREFLGRFIGSRPGASLNLTWTPTSDQIGNLNLKYSQFNVNRLERYTQTAIGEFIENPPDGVNNGEDGTEISRFSEDEWEGQIDGDYELPFAGGRLKVIGFYRQEHSPTIASFFDFNNDGDLLEQTEFHQTADEGEAILKSEYNWSRREGRDWQISVEGAYNFLDIENQFFDRLVPSENSDLNFLGIEENRAEGFLTHTRKLSDKWSLQASIGAEYSELTTGDQTRTFARPKGFMSATYVPSNTINITAKIERQIGQLNFFDFSSSVSLDEEVSDRGTNLDLVPEQAWWGELSFNKTFADGHALEIEAHGRIVSDIVDQIPLNVDVLDADGMFIGTDFTTGVGNIGSGEQGGIHINGTLKGDPYGLKGMEIRAGAAWHISNVTDPITGQSRQFSGQRLSDWFVNFRHDIPDTSLAWGFEFETFEDGSNFRPFEISRFDQRPGENEFFIEHKDLLGMKVRLELDSLIETGNRLDRIIFSNRRDLPGAVISRIENRRRNFNGPIVSLQISDTF